MNYYSILLEDGFTAPWVSWISDYFGTEAEIRTYGEAVLREAEYPEAFSFLEELNFRKENTKLEPGAVHSAQVYGEHSFSIGAGSWTQLNVWESPNTFKFSSAEGNRLWLSTKGRFLRCIKVHFTDLAFAEHENFPEWPVSKFWGASKILAKEQNVVYNRLYEPEEWFDSEEELLEDMRKQKEAPIFCFDYFGGEILGAG